MISEKPRPIQSSAGSPERFSKRRTATRGERPFGRVQLVRQTSRQASRPTLKNTRLQREQLLKLRQFAQGGKFWILQQLLALGEAFFEGLPDVLQRPLVLPGLGIGPGQVVVEFCALLDAALLQQH